MTTMRASGETLGGKKSTNSPQIVFKCINIGLVCTLVGLRIASVCVGHNVRVYAGKGYHYP